MAAKNVIINAPKITPNSCNYNGTIIPVITADEGCSIVYVKSTKQVYTTIEAIDAAKGVKTEASNEATITDIQGKTGNRYISAYAVKSVNGTEYKSAVTTATYTYKANAIPKTGITLSGPAITLDMSHATTTATLDITAKDSNGKEVTGLPYIYEVHPEGIVTISKDGVVTPKQAGTASITVIFEGNELYNEATCIVDVNVAATSTYTQKIFYRIADLRHATQSITTGTYKDNKKNIGCALIFKEDNPARVIAVMEKPDKDVENDKFINSFFIIDASDRGLWITANDIVSPSKYNLKQGSKFTGTIVGTYTEGTSKIPAFTEIKSNLDITTENTTIKYKTNINIDNSETEQDNTLTICPFTKIQDVYTLAKTNETDQTGDIVNTSYGVYVNSIVQVPGTIKATQSTTGEKEFYLVQDENTDVSNTTNRIYFNSSQIDVDLQDYVGTSGEFKGILIKRNNSEPKLVVLKADFFQINKIYLDENDPEERITELVNSGAFNDEVDVYVHRTNLINKANAWNTLCFPFDMSQDEFKSAFGYKLIALAKPATSTDTKEHQWEGQVSEEGVLSFTKIKDDNLNIIAGVPYLMQASGEQVTCTQTISGAENMTPQELMAKDANYYAHIGQKLIAVVPPHEIKAYYNNSIVNGNFYFRGLYGCKKYTEDINGKLTTTLIADGGSQKYQYISTAPGNYLKYLPSDSVLKFNGMRAYFYFPNWNKEENNKLQQSTTSNINSKIHIMVSESETTGIKNVKNFGTQESKDLYNLAGQKVDSSYQGIVIKNGKKYLLK